jgi:hypothetical protein
VVNQTPRSAFEMLYYRIGGWQLKILLQTNEKNILFLQCNYEKNK